MRDDRTISRGAKAAIAAGALVLALTIGLRVSDIAAREPEAAAPQTAPPAAHPAVAPKPVADDPLVVRHVLPIAGAMRIGDCHWDEAGAPAAGPLVITVDLQAQVLSLFSGGWEIGTAAILYGVDDKLTPLGTFPVLWKDAHHISSIYDAPMPYTMRLTGDGVSIHGSPKMVSGYATHGCVGLPIPFARKLFEAVPVGTRVIITDGRRLSLGQHI